MQERHFPPPPHHPLLKHWFCLSDLQLLLIFFSLFPSPGNYGFLSMRFKKDFWYTSVLSKFPLPPPLSCDRLFPYLGCDVPGSGKLHLPQIPTALAHSLSFFASWLNLVIDFQVLEWPSAMFSPCSLAARCPPTSLSPVPFLLRFFAFFAWFRDTGPSVSFAATSEKPLYQGDRVPSFLSFLPFFHFAPPFLPD